MRVATSVSRLLALSRAAAAASRVSFSLTRDAATVSSAWTMPSSMLSSWASSLGHLLAQRLDGRGGGVPGAKLGHLAGEIGFLLGEAAGARIVLGDLVFELAALGAQFRRFGGERGKCCIGVVQHIQRGFGAFGGLGASLGAVALGS